MYEYLIYSRLKKYAGAKKSFHIPGHKNKGEFKKFFPDSAIDVTELSYSDNLFCPEDVIAAAQRDIAEILGAKKSYILTDGSSCGVRAMLYAASRRGNKVITPRNCHSSVWEACKLLGLEPVIVQGAEKEGALLPPDPETIEKLLVNDINISAVIALSPDYYGNIAPLAKYGEITKRYSRLLLVDGAHGAHLAFEPKRKGYAGVHADAWVDGAHKSLPVLTQGAVLNVNNTEIDADIQAGIRAFATTSPSYPIMASVEYGIKYIANNPKILKAAKAAAEAFKTSTGKALTFYPSGDWTKLVIDFKPYNISADKALEGLEKKGVYAELSDGRYIIFYLSAVTDAGELANLKAKLPAVITNKRNKGTYSARPRIPEAERTYSYQYALRQPFEYVDIHDAAGKMAACNAGFTPPCIPVVIAGEIITEAAVNLLSSGRKVYGLTNGKIKVVKKR